MPKKVKSLTSILLSILVIFSLIVSVDAIEPRYSDTDSITIGLGITGTTASCTVMIYGADGTTSIDKVNITLKDSKGNVKGEWKNLSTNSRKFTFFETVSNLIVGESYTLEFSANINRRTGVETIKDSRTATCSGK